MPDSRHPSHRPDGSTEDRFLHWVDHLVDPATGAAPPPDPDFADVAVTATSIHRTAGLGAATAPPPQRADAMWESLMHTTTMPASTVDPAAFNGSAPPVALRPVTTEPGPGWRSWLMAAALIAAVVIASVITIWRITDPLDNRNPGTANQPGFVASATPATETADGCDLTRDMLVFVGEVPSFEGTDLDPTIAVVQPDGDFVVTCDGVENPEPLMTGVKNALGLGWPGTVLLEQESGVTIAYNIATDQRTPLGSFDLASPFWYSNDQGAPWLLTPNNEAFTDWRLTNLKTMRSLILSEEIGGVLEENDFPSLVTVPGADNAIVSFESFFEPSSVPENAPDATIAERPDGALVVDATFETRRWIDTWGRLAISADSEVIAYQTQIDLVPMIRVEDSTSGETLTEITDINFNKSSNALFAFAGDSETLIYLNNDEIWLATYGDEPTTNLLAAGDMQPTGLYPTGVPGHVLIERRTDENIGGPDVADAKAVSILDTASGRVTDVEGIMPIDGLFAIDPSGQFDSLRYIVTLAPSPASNSQTIARVTDIASGETILTSEPIGVSVQELVESNNVIGHSGAGDIFVLSPPGGEAVLLNSTTSTTARITIPTAERAGETGRIRWSVTPSHDGTHLYAIGLPQPEVEAGLDIESVSALRQQGSFAIAPVSTDPNWSSPTDSLPAGIIHGIPTGTDNEPAVLEAQQITPIAASPAATPAPPVAAGCDLTGDMPIFAGSAPNDLALNTWLLLDDRGTLTLNCDETSETIASGIEQVKPTDWPGIIILVTQDGAVRALNLTNGATLQLESNALLDASGRLTNEPTETLDIRMTPHSPWLITAANDDHTDWRITDLRTMESFLLSDETGNALSTPYYPQTFSSLGSSMVAAVAFLPESMTATPTSPGFTPPEAITTEGNVLLLAGSVEERRWIDLARPVAWRLGATVTVHPDGSLIAYPAMSSTGELVIRVEQTDDGANVAEIPLDAGARDFTMQLAGSTPRLVLSTGETIEIVTWDPAIERTPVDIDPLSLDTDFYSTANPDVILLEQGGGAMTIDLTDGTVLHTYQYVPHLSSQLQFSDGHGYIDTMITVAAEVPDGFDLAVIQVVNPVTGEVLADSQTLGVHPVQLTQTYGSFLVRDGTLAILQLPPDSAMEVPPLPPAAVIVLDVNTGETWMIKLPPYDDWYLIAPPDGQYLSYVPAGNILDGEREPFMMKSTGVGSDWVEVPAGSVPKPVIGTHALP